MNLSQQEVEEFTGADKVIKQRNIFKKNKIPYINQANGHITTTWEAINHALLMQKNASNEPDFSSLD